MERYSQVKKERQKTENATGAAATLLNDLNSGSDTSIKDKTISVRVNSYIYSQFSKICRASGTTSSGMITMLITKYVSENKDMLEK